MSLNILGLSNFAVPRSPHSCYLFTHLQVWQNYANFTYSQRLKWSSNSICIWKLYIHSKSKGSNSFNCLWKFLKCSYPPTHPFVCPNRVKSPFQQSLNRSADSKCHWIIETMWAIDTICRHRNWYAFVQVMAWWLTAPNQYINKRWLIISEILMHSLEGNSTRNVWNIEPCYEI